MEQYHYITEGPMASLRGDCAAPDSGYNSPYQPRRFAPAGLMMLPSISTPDLSYVPSHLQAPRLHVAFSSQESVLSGQSSRDGSPILSHKMKDRKPGRAQRSPVRGLSKASDGTGVAFCFSPSPMGKQASLTVVHRKFREPRSQSLSPQPGDYDQPAAMDVSEDGHSTAEEDEQMVTVASAKSHASSTNHSHHNGGYHYPTHGSSNHHHNQQQIHSSHQHQHHNSSHNQHHAGGRTSRIKQCACCHVTSTPLWRDIGGLMPLCNACGIRWKKYGLVCPNCQYVPCKQERESKLCTRCGTLLPPASKRAKLPSS